MSYYLLPGSEFRDKLTDIFSDVGGVTETIVFSYTDKYSDRISGITAVPVDFDEAGSINAYVLDEGKTILILSKSDIYCKDCQMMFYRMKVLEKISFENFNTSECTNMHRMFMTCYKLRYVNMSTQTSANVMDFSEMFNECPEVSFIDIRNFTLTADPETCDFVDMFKGCSGLRRLSVGRNFQYSPEMELANPKTSYIQDSDGKWHDLTTGISYDSDDLPSNIDTTYYAIDVSPKTALDTSIMSFETMRAVAEQIAISVNNKFMFHNT